jgi:hypothetical protein
MGVGRGVINLNGKHMGTNEGERLGRARYGEQVYGEGVNSPEGGAARRAAENKYAQDLVEGERNRKVEGLRQAITEKEAELFAVQASIEAIVTQIRQGEQLAQESQNLAVQEVNQKLSAEAQEQKLKLLAQKETLEAGIRKLEEEIAAL